MRRICQACPPPPPPPLPSSSLVVFWGLRESVCARETLNQFFSSSSVLVDGNEETLGSWKVKRKMICTSEVCVSVYLCSVFFLSSYYIVILNVSLMFYCGFRVQENNCLEIVLLLDCWICLKKRKLFVC